jgi:archaellum component FlaC
MFKWFKKDKEKPMAETTTVTRNTRQIKKQLQIQNEEITNLRDRISDLRDEMVVMTHTIATFQDKVQKDMTTAFEALESLHRR